MSIHTKPNVTKGTYYKIDTSLHWPSGTYKHTMKKSLAALLLPIVGITGCFTTYLNDYQRNENLEALLLSASHKVSLEVADQDISTSRGYQFFLGLFPLTRIFPIHTAHMVTARLQQHAGALNYNLCNTPPLSSNHDKLLVHIQSVSVNGYDLIFRRLPKASITMKGTISWRDGTVRHCQASGTHSEFTNFAFSSQLNRTLERAVDIASQKLLLCLLE